MAADSVSGPASPVRTAELASAVCLASDLAMGFPWGHGLEATVATMRLCELADADAATRRQAYYLSLLTFAGCTADAAVKARIFGGPATEALAGVIWGGRREQMTGVLRTLPAPGSSWVGAVSQVGVGLPRAIAHRPRELLALCEVAQHVSRHLGLGTDVAEAFGYLTERWDGHGVLGRGRATELPIALRIALVARDGAYHAAAGGTAHAAEVLTHRAGRAHDPRVAGLLAHDHPDVLAGPGDRAVQDVVLDLEPGPPLQLGAERLDDAVAVLGELADVISPTTAGRSAQVAQVAADAAQLLGLGTADVDRVRRAARLQDVGRIGVPARVWDQPGALTPADGEQMRLHPYRTERICSASPFLRPLGEDARCHHERLDGSGYHRGVGASDLGPRARILMAAEEWCVARDAGPRGAGLDGDAAARQLADDVERDRLDADAVAAVVEAAGWRPPPVRRPAGLTEQEVRVLTLVARGHATKQVARVLRISPKTADQHLQHVYRKIGTSSRAAAALYASEHGLLAWGEFPISR